MKLQQDSEKKYMKGAEPFFIEKSKEVGILLLHGFTSSPYQFREIANYLIDKNFTVYCPLIAGHGTNPDELMKTNIKDWVNSVENALKELEKKVKKIFIVGHSFGGNLALYLAEKFNNPIQGVVSLGTPINLRWDKVIKLRVYTYGWLKRYYRKRGPDYKTEYVDSSDQISYPVIPIKSLRLFFKFIKKITLPSLTKIKIPTLLIQAHDDPVVHDCSVQKIHEHLGSDFKKVCWLNGRYHSLTEGDERGEVYKKIYEFIQEISDFK